MRRPLATLLPAFALVVLVGLESAGQSNKDKAAPVLALRIIPAKQTYALNEKVLAKYEFINRSDQPLCLPHPNLECSDTRSGSVKTAARQVQPTGEDREIFICFLDGGGWGPSSKVPWEIRKHWIEIAPGEVYVTDSAEAVGRLDALGEWRLEATYQPPQAAFGDPVRFKKELRDGARKVGCTIPESVDSEPVVVDVIPQK